VSWLSPGEDKARKVLNRFVRERLEAYPAHRNDPAKDASSHLSPYLHFGQISAQRVALEVEKSRVRREAKDHFLEELIVRRELSDNFCLYNDRYDSIEGLPRWGQITIDEHRNDPRQIIYSREVLEKAQTHDPLWNAGQMEMVNRGKMHGYVRMYWAKKVLEWTRSPEQAFDTLIYLNDRYEMDGRDPNGYVGIAWSIGGLHDRPWPERHIFGKIRYMSYNGVRKKINVSAYERLVASIDGEPRES
jgi:deoxyribodipyrimidine photo-lyase